MRSFAMLCVVLLACGTLSFGVSADEWPESGDYPIPARQLETFETSQYGRSPLVHFLNHSVLITANGESRIEIPADYAEISATAETVYTNKSGVLADQASILRDVSQRTAVIMTRVLEVLRANPNVTKITTTQVDLSPIYDWTSGAQTLVGYRAVNSIRFRVVVGSAGTVLASIVDTGISRIDSITYSASDQHIAAARTRAIQEAIKDAQMQATAMTSTIPTTTTPTIFRIDMMDASPPNPVPMPYAFSAEGGMAMARLASSPQPIVGGNLVIVARVAVRFVVRKESLSLLSTPTRARATQ